ncbi:MAG: hypothetical protein ACM3US_09880 [Sphingomonadaceae bacterium]
MSDETPQVWERIRGSRTPYVKGESRQAYDAFCHYRDLPPSERSYDRAYANHLRTCLHREGIGERAKCIRRWHYWASEYTWVARAEAFDAYLDKLKREEIERIQREEAAYWSEVRKRIPREEVEYAEKLIAKAREMLEFPLAAVKSMTVERDGKTIVTTIVEPGRWNFGTAVKMLELAQRMRRLAAEMETDRTKIDIAMVRAEARRIAEAYGIAEDEVLAQAEEIARAYVQGETEKIVPFRRRA